MAVFSLPLSSSVSPASAEAFLKHKLHLRVDLFEQGLIESDKQDTFAAFKNMFRMVSELSPSNAEHLCQGFADGLQGFQSAAMALADALDLPVSNNS